MFQPTAWWGDVSFPDARRSYWRLGALELLVERCGSEWTITTALGDDIFDETCMHEPETSRLLDGTRVRVVGAHADTLQLMPRLLDRTVVSRPLSPIEILPGTTADLFMTTPTEIVLSVAGQALTALSSAVMRRTWIGADTRKGEVGYATRTTARLALSYLTVHPTRAVTQVRIHNQRAENLRLDRVNLPVRQLALFAAKDGRLCTADLRLKVSQGDVVEVQTDARPPTHAPDAALLAAASDPIDRSMMRRVLGALFA